MGVLDLGLVEQIRKSQGTCIIFLKAQSTDRCITHVRSLGNSKLAWRNLDDKKETMRKVVDEPN